MIGRCSPAQYRPGAYNHFHMLKPDGEEFQSRLLGWFDENARDLPWRRTSDPYAIWVSEIMLQQTRVAAVVEHYERFMRRYPDLHALAAASEADVLASWSGLGYYRRARLLHKAAKFVAGELDGRLPETSAGLRTLPGIGEYTCAAIASIGFGEAVAVIDGNVERVLTRLLGWDEKTALITKLRATAARLLDRERPGDFNQAMMELGATVCLPRAPLCLQCPVQALCATQGEHAVGERRKMKSQRAAYAFLHRVPGVGAGKVTESVSRRGVPEVLLVQRPQDATLMPGMWELPAIDPETAASERRLLDVRHSITVTNYYVTVYGYEPEEEGALPPAGRALRRWFPEPELVEIPLTGLARKVLKRLKALPGYAPPGATMRFEASGPEFLQWK
jgi:A/G-specific adenine glycosylase